MNETIIQNLNNRVTAKDTLFFLGDLLFTRGNVMEETRRLLALINCKNIICILGNHDPHDAYDQPDREWAKLFAGCFNLLKIKVPYRGSSQTIILSHYAMRVWNHSHHSAWAIYGHSHSSLPDDPNTLSFDVGIDSISCYKSGITMDQALKMKEKNGYSPLKPEHYVPIDMDELGTIMAKKNFKPIDHHTDQNLKRDGG